jgi:hypothetical protein
LPCYSTFLFLARIANAVFIGYDPNCLPKDIGVVPYVLAEEENKKETHACRERKKINDVNAYT